MNNKIKIILVLVSMFMIGIVITPTPQDTSNKTEMPKTIPNIF